MEKQNDRQFTATMPKLPKYMGKANAQLNLPLNTSLSLTLDHLVATVTLKPKPSGSAPNQHTWHAHPDCLPLTLSTAGQEKFLRHLSWMQTQFNDATCFAVSSGNNFPAACGIASSAASFAALTQAYANYLSATHSVHGN